MIQSRMICVVIEQITGEHEFLDVWNEAYAAIMRYARSDDGLWVSIEFLSPLHRT